MADNSFSNPIAPASAAAISNLGGGSGLSNSDFRKFLMTPRASDVEEQSKFSHLDPTRAAAAKPKATPEQIAEFRKLKQAKKLEKQKKKSSMFPEGYRDRAAERRSGAGEAEDDTKMSIGLHNMPPPSDDQMDPEELRRQEYERSKYLGGDLDHTHLVKGLDYALLDKVQKEIEEEERQKEEEKAREEQEAQSKLFPVKQLIIAGGTIRAMEMPTEIKTALGRNLFREIFLKKFPETVETFAKGRTTLVFELDPELNQELPTIVTKSKEDLPVMEELVSGEINPEIIEKIGKIMGYIKHGKKIKKQSDVKPEVKPEPVQPAKPKASSTSIFDDVDDDYTFDEGADKAAAASHVVGPMMPQLGPSDGSEYDFSSDAAFDALPPLPKASAVTAKKPTIEDKPKEKKKTEEDDYMECYPSTYEGIGFAQVDEDEEADDITKRDSKRKLKRWDFETDEEWLKYENTREATPKAAYQFGVKMADGRKTKQQKGQKTAKINNQMKKIENIWDNKKRKAESGDEPKESGNKRFKAGEFGF